MPALRTALALAATAGALALTPAAHATTPGKTRYASQNADGTAGGGDANGGAMSADGRYVVFQSTQHGLVSGFTDANSTGFDVYRRDQLTGTTVLVSHAAGSTTTSANDTSDASTISADGRFVLFRSRATDLVGGFVDHNAPSVADLYLADLEHGTVALVSHAAGSATDGGAGAITSLTLAAGGAAVYFGSTAPDMVAGFADHNGTASDAYRYDVATGAISLVSHTSAGATVGAAGESFPLVTTPDGRFVLFSSTADGLAGTDSNGVADVFRRDTASDAIDLVSARNNSAEAGDGAAKTAAAIAPDGRYVAFTSDATNLTAAIDDNGASDCFRRDVQQQRTRLEDAATGGVLRVGNARCSAAADITPDGDIVTFISDASDLTTVPDGNAAADVFQHVESSGATRLASVNAAGTAAAGAINPRASTDGRYVVFASAAGDVAPGVTDAGGLFDVFRRDMTAGVTQLVSARPDGNPANSASTTPFATPDGAFVAWTSDATDFDPAVVDAPASRDVLTRGNFPPGPAFTAATAPLAVALNASGSSDPEGPLAAFDWDFGDGSTGSGETTGHTYAAPGDYAVTLTVTDADGARRSVTHVLSVPPAPTPGGGGGGRGNTSGGGPGAAPRLDFPAGRIARLRHGRLTFLVRSTASATLSVSGTVAAPHLRVRLARARVKLTAGRRTTVAVRLSRSAAAKLARARKHRKRATAQLKLTLDQAAPISVRLRVR